MDLFKTMDSEYIKLCRINDVLDELYKGKNKQQIHPAYFDEKEDEETGKKVLTFEPDKGVVRTEDGKWKVSDEYLKYYKDETSIDYSAVLMLRKKVYESREDGVETAPEDKGHVDLSNLIGNTNGKTPKDVQIEALKALALRFYTSIFPDEGQPGATDFSIKTLSKVKKIIYPETYGFDDQYGELWIYTTDELIDNPKVKDNKQLSKNGTNKNVEFADGTEKHMVLLCLGKDDNGAYTPTFQKLYTLVHEISHSIGNEDRNGNTRVGNLFGETESMIIESLFSKFLLDNDDIQIPDKEKRVLNYEHGSSRVRTRGELLNIYKLAAQFYQRKQEEIQGEDVYIDFEDEKTMNAVFMDLFGRNVTPKDRKTIMDDLKEYKGWDPKHVCNDYFSPRYEIGNLIAPYIVNTYFANPQLGRQYIEKFFNMAYGKNPDGSEHTIADVFGSIGIEGTKGIERLANEYTEWVTRASNGETDKLFRGKTRYQLAERTKYVTGRKLGSQAVADMQDIETTDKENAEIARQQREISQTKENQDIGG